MVESIVGIFEPCSTCFAMAASLSPVKLSARQYHCNPGTNRPSKVLCTAGNGAGPTASSNGAPTLRIGRVAFSVCSAVPVLHRRWRKPFSNEEFRETWAREGSQEKQRIHSLPREP